MRWQRPAGASGAAYWRLIPYAVLILAVALVAQRPPNNDVAWHLSIGRALANGAGLYTDIVEINPPLWFWLAVPINQVADAFGVTANTVLLGFLGLAMALSISLCRGDWRVLSAAVVIVFGVSISAIGQREQFTLIAVLPYLFLTAARAEKRQVDPRFAIAVGLWAASGLALKPYFAVVPIAVQLWLGGRLRPEFVAIVAAGAAYVGAVLLFEPDYLGVLALTLSSYSAMNMPLWSLVTGDVTRIAILFGVGLFLSRPLPPLTRALLVAALAFLACYFIQTKGFRYHAFPALVLFCLAAVTTSRNSLFAKAALAIAILTAFATTMVQTKSSSGIVQAATADLPPGTPVLVLTASGGLPWPAVEINRLRWASRYMFLWTLPKAASDPAAAAELRLHVAQDIEKYRPRRIFLDSRETRWRVDLVRFFFDDPRLRSAMKGYRRCSSVAFLHVYERGTCPPARPATR